MPGTQFRLAVRDETTSVLFLSYHGHSTLLRNVLMWAQLLTIGLILFAGGDLAPQSKAQQNPEPRNAAPQNTVSQNTVSQNTVLQNTVLQNTVPQMRLSVVGELPFSGKGPCVLLWSHDGEFLCVAGRDGFGEFGRVSFTNSESASSTSTFLPMIRLTHGAPIRRLFWNPDSRYIASIAEAGSEQSQWEVLGQLREFKGPEVEEATVRHPLFLRGEVVTSAAWNHNSFYLAIGGDNGFAALFRVVQRGDHEESECFAHFRMGTITDFQWSPDHRNLLAVSDAKRSCVMVWDGNTPKDLLERIPNPKIENAGERTRDLLPRYTAEELMAVRKFRATDKPSRVAWAPNGEKLAILTGTTLRIWDPVANQEVALTGDGAEFSDLCWNLSDGSGLVAADTNGTLWHWTYPGLERSSLPTGKAIFNLHWGVKGDLVALGQEDLVTIVSVGKGTPANSIAESSK